MDRSRVTVLSALLLLPLGGLLLRLVHLQIVNAHEAAGDLASRRRSIQLAPAPRGRILDAKGRTLAEDRRSFDCYVVLEEHEKSPGPLPLLLGMPPDEFRQEVEKIYAKIERQAAPRPPRERQRLYVRERRTPYLLLRDIPFEAALTIETNPQTYAGAVVRESLRRHYPRGPVGCHLTGYLGRVTSDEDEFRALLQNGCFTGGFAELVGEDGIAQLYRRGAFHEELVGRAGLERRYDDDLRGRAGLLVLEREPGTSNRSTVELKPPRAGQDVELTVDIELQAAVEKILEGPQRAAAVVMSPAGGEVLALASNRLFDPNDFVPPGNTAAIREALNDRENQPLASRAFARHYQLGSIFKVVTSAAALEGGKVRPGETLPCRGRFFENSRHFGCWIWNMHQGMHGDLTLAGALERSCNNYFYEAGRRCGLGEIARWALALGYGAPTGIDLPGEAGGVVPRTERSGRDALSLAIGQHELMATPLQAAVMMAAVANGGRRVTPHLRRGSAPPPRPAGISAGTLAEIRRGLCDVVHAAEGTAYGSPLRELESRGFAVCGKTSSAQTREGQNSHAWFAGYAPRDNPRFVVVVFVEYGGGGGQAAAPPAATIFNQILDSGF